MSFYLFVLFRDGARIVLAEILTPPFVNRRQPPFFILPIYHPCPPRRRAGPTCPRCKMARADRALGGLFGFIAEEVFWNLAGYMVLLLTCCGTGASEGSWEGTCELNLVAELSNETCVRQVVLDR